MNKKYIVRLEDSERETCKEVIRRLKGSSQKVRRAQILLKIDADGPAWSDERVAEAFCCRVQTVENLRKRLVTEGFQVVLDRKKRDVTPTEKILNGEQEAKLIAMRLGVSGHEISATLFTVSGLDSRRLMVTSWPLALRPLGI